VTAAITPSQFHAADGVEDWRILFSGANAHFRTGSYEAAVALVAEIGRLAAAAGHRPDVDLRPGGVFVRLWTPEAGWQLSERDLELARGVSAAARKAGAEADPAAVQYVQLTVDALAAPAVMAFWRAILGYRRPGGLRRARPGLVDARRPGGQRGRHRHLARPGVRRSSP
jgi:4a-hydroxytetrahydrobiopterin dehydratase